MNVPPITRNLSSVPILTVAQQALTGVERESQGISQDQCYKIVQYVLTMTAESIDEAKVLLNNNLNEKKICNNDQEDQSSTNNNTQQNDSNVFAKVFQQLMHVTLTKSSIELEYLAIVVNKKMGSESSIRKTLLLFGVKLDKRGEFEYSTYYSRLSKANDEEQLVLYTRQYSVLNKNTADYLDVVEFEKREESNVVDVKISNIRYLGTMVSCNSEVSRSALSLDLITTGISELW